MRNYRFGARLIAPLIVAVAAAGCGDLLEVTDPDIVTPEQAAGPAAVPLLVAGMVGDFQEAVDGLVRYEALFTDEMILSGTFPTRIDVDERDVLTDINNGTLSNDVFEPLQIARETADQNREMFLAALEDEDFDEVLASVEEGLALASLFAGYVRLYMAELYCSVIMEPEGSAVSPDAAADTALARFIEAENYATDFGLTNIADAARVGQARALVWLGRYDEAAAVAADVSPEFVFLAEYSENQNAQFNEVFSFTWGRGGQVARWTVGDGTSANRHNERFSYYDEWVSQGLLLPNPPGMQAPEVGVAMTLQLLYDAGSRPIVVASWWEAQMIVAEHELRNGNPETAEDIVNALLADPALNPMTDVNPGLTSARVVLGQSVPALGPFDPVNFTGDLATDLPQLARARLAGLWLTGTRQPTLRRFATEDNVDLYPTGTRGDDVYFPIPQTEIDNNPNVSGPCPA